MDGAASPTRPGCSAGWREITRPARATCHPFRYKTLPTRAGRRHYRYKTRPARTTRRHLRYKTRPARPKWPNLARFPLAGRIFPVFVANKPRTPPVPVQNSPCTSRAAAFPVQNSPHASWAPAVPVQNSPSTPKMASFGAFSSRWESFVPLLSPTSQAGRIFSRTSPTPSRARKKQHPNTTLQAAR